MLFRYAIALLMLALPVFPALAGGPALVVEAKDGRVLYAEAPDYLWHPASLTKLMTAYVAFEAIKNGEVTLDTNVKCSRLAQRQAPSKIGLPIGAKMPLRLALKALIIKSANDVAVMIAEGVGGTEPLFVKRMNEAARRLGMTRTKFVNPNGLPDVRQITTARDMAILTRALMREFPQYDYLYKLAQFRIGRRVIRSHNGLLFSLAGADGMKTGFVCASGYNIVASATRDDRRIIAVVMGGRSSGARNARAARLLEYGFKVRDWKKLFSAETIGSLPLAPTRVQGPDDIRRYACGYRRARVKRKYKARRSAIKRRKLRRKYKRKRKR